jgi:glutaredoxin 3
MDNYAVFDNPEYFIYTKSTCKYCIELKEYLSSKNKTFKTVLCNGYDREPFLKKIKEMTGQDWKTFPIVFKNNEFIGGYTETFQLIEKEEAFRFL